LVIGLDSHLEYYMVFAILALIDLLSRNLLPGLQLHVLVSWVRQHERRTVKGGVEAHLSDRHESGSSQLGGNGYLEGTQATFCYSCYCCGEYHRLTGWYDGGFG
jgi:hypothetical protein